MARVTDDQRPPALALHGIAGRELPKNIAVEGGTLTSPVLTMKTSGGDAYTSDPGVGAASMIDDTTLRLLWSAADMSALNDTTRPKTYIIEVAGSVDGSNPASLIGGTLTVYPTGSAKTLSSSATTLTLNGGNALTLSVTFPDPSEAIDGGAADWTADTIDGGSATDTFTDTTYDGGSI